MLNRSGQAERNIGSMGTVPKLPSFDKKKLMTWTHIYIDLRDRQLCKDGLRKGGHNMRVCFLRVTHCRCFI